MFEIVDKLVWMFVLCLPKKPILEPNGAKIAYSSVLGKKADFEGKGPQNSSNLTNEICVNHS